MLNLETDAVLWEGLLHLDPPTCKVLGAESGLRSHVPTQAWGRLRSEQSSPAAAWGGRSRSPAQWGRGGHRPGVREPPTGSGTQGMSLTPPHPHLKTEAVGLDLV